LTGTWVTDQLKKASEKGYVVQRIYEVWHFDETEQYDPKTKTGGLYRLREYLPQNEAGSQRLARVVSERKRYYLIKMAKASKIQMKTQTLEPVSTESERYLLFGQKMQYL
jgi:hypothetical protein